MIDGMCYHNAMTLLCRMNQLKAYMCSRSLFVILALIAPIRMFGAGWTPTDAGLFVNLQPDDKFLLSVWIDDDGDGVEDAGEEYFVCHYNGYTGGKKFSYGTGNFLKLIPQDAGATEPSGVSIWTVDTALTRPATVQCHPLDRGFHTGRFCAILLSSKCCSHRKNTMIIIC